ncbi:MAG: hypothetical protein DRI40_05640, partial [Chloroflexi bacterium]
MDFALSAEQELLKKEARHFLQTECSKKVVKEIEASETGFSGAIWKKMAELGWLGLVVPEQYGGVGGNLLDLAVLFEELGRSAFPSPMFSTIVLGALPVLEAGSEKQKAELLPKVTSGDLILTLALSEPEVEYDLRYISARGIQTGGGFVLEGTKLFVPNAHIADQMLVIAGTGESGG